MQARISSERFPGKVLYELEGKPMLAYLLESLSCCISLDTIVVATSDDYSDNVVAEYCRSKGVNCFRGSLQNVAERFKGVIENYGMRSFVRICADSPLLDYMLVDQAVNEFLVGNFDAVTNVQPRSFPKGESVEVFNSALFLREFGRILRNDDLEHVTSYFYRNRNNFTIRNMSADADCSHVRLCVDTQEDMDVVASVIRKMERPHTQYRMSELIRFYNQVTGDVADWSV